MSNEIEKFDPATLMQGVKDRVKATFVSLIPESHWEQMCNKEIEDFFRGKETSYNHREMKSDFQIICRRVLEELATAQVKEFLSLHTCTGWNNGPLMSDKLKELLIENADKILMSAFGNMFQSAINSMGNRY